MLQQETVDYTETRKIIYQGIEFTVWVKLWSTQFGKFAWGFLNPVNGQGLGGWCDTASNAWATAIEAIGKVERETDDLSALH